MEACTPPSPLLIFLPLVIASMVIAAVANILARQKRRSVVAWTALEAIPFVNFLLVWYFAGAVNQGLEEKSIASLQVWEKQLAVPAQIVKSSYSDSFVLVV
jgi:hypothetical protein